MLFSNSKIRYPYTDTQLTSYLIHMYGYTPKELEGLSDSALLLKALQAGSLTELQWFINLDSKAIQSLS